MPDQPVVGRADTLKIGGPSGLTNLSGDVMRRLRRYVLAMQGTDFNVNSIGMQEALQPSVLLQDASGAPFRTNGKAWQQAANLTAGAGFATWQVENPPFDGRRLFVAVVDWFEYAGASVAQYGIILGRRFTITDTVPSLEDNGLGTSLAYVRPATVLTFATSTANATAFAAFGNQSIGFVPNTGATGLPARVTLGDTVLWPNETLMIEQATGATAGMVTIHGRLWDFGSLVAAQLP